MDYSVSQRERRQIQKGPSFADTTIVGAAADPIDLPDSSFAQPLLTDVNGNLAMDLLGHVPGGTSGLKVWKNTMASNNTFAV